MDIYKNKIKIGSIPDRIKAKGGICTRLKGLNLVQAPETTEVQAVYQSAIRVSREGNLLFIDFVAGTKTYTVILVNKFPFFAFAKGDTMIFSEEL